MKSRLASLASYHGQDIHHENCFACGVKNPHRLAVPSTFDESTGEVRFVYTLEKSHEGAPGHSHGGVLASILDEAQGVLCHHLGYFVMTDYFTIKYHKATPLYVPLHIRAYLSAARRRRLYTRATICLENADLLVESAIRWYILPEKLLVRKFHFDERSEKAQHMIQVFEANRLRAREIRRRLKKNQQGSHQ
ncbi:MAG: PaaI family thioesterase [Leptospiraceae bacterium]|nr:PaaI family thioesterase [Leptospiraceae bacterium]MDW8306238.1 PaaI family thioesterase [Leptospiraceae bacterium]